MKTWRETKIGKDINRPNSKNMTGIKNKEALKREIKLQKEKQRKQIRIIKDEIKKIEQLRLSLEGLEKISESSIKAIQQRREKSIQKIKTASNTIASISTGLKRIEIKFANLR